MRRSNNTDNKYKEGQVVYALENPDLGLIVRRYLDRIYYCKVQDDPGRKDLVYFGRELTDKSATV